MNRENICSSDSSLKHVCVHVQYMCLCYFYPPHSIFFFFTSQSEPVKPLTHRRRAGNVLIGVMNDKPTAALFFCLLQTYKNKPSRTTTNVVTMHGVILLLHAVLSEQRMKGNAAQSKVKSKRKQ